MGDGADIALSDMMDDEDLRTDYRLGHLGLSEALDLGILDEHGVLEDIKIKQEADKPKLQCPKCGGQMKLREGKFGKFWGCSDFPKCKGSRKV